MTRTPVTTVTTVTTALRFLVRASAAYAASQLALGVQAGAGAAVLVVACGWALPEALLAACVAVVPVGLAQLALLRRIGLV